MRNISYEQINMFNFSVLEKFYMLLVNAMLAFE